MVLKKLVPPKPLKGRQVLHLVKTFFEVDADQGLTFELTSLIDLQYGGDAKLAPWKSHWDNMLRNQRNPVTPGQAEEIFLKKIRGSELLKAFVDHYDRSVKGAPERSYQWLSSMVDKAIKELMELYDACIDTGMSYAERAALREQEIEALKKALCILDTMGPACCGK